MIQVRGPGRTTWPNLAGHPQAPPDRDHRRLRVREVLAGVRDHRRRVATADQRDLHRFVPSFMPSLAGPTWTRSKGCRGDHGRPERIGANARSTVGTATDAIAMLRICSAGSDRRARSSFHFSFNLPTACAPVRGLGPGHRDRPGRAVRPRPVTRTRARSGLGYSVTAGRCATSRRPARPGQAAARLHRVGAGRLLQGPGQGQGRNINTTYEGLVAKRPEVVPEGTRGAAAAHPGLRGAGGHLHRLSRVRRQPAQRGRPRLLGSRDTRSPTPARCRSATWPKFVRGLDDRRWRRCWPPCGRPSTPSSRSDWATSASTAHPARSPVARHNA